MLGIGRRFYAWKRRLVGIHVSPDLPKSDRWIVESADEFFARAPISMLNASEPDNYTYRDGSSWSFQIARLSSGAKVARVYVDVPGGGKRLIATFDEPEPLF